MDHRMGDRRFVRDYDAVRAAEDPAAAIGVLSDAGVVQALAGASLNQDPYLANVLATEALNRLMRAAAVARSVADGVVVLDRDRRIRLVNAAAEDLLGCREADVLGADPVDVFAATTSDGTPLRGEERPAVHALSGVKDSREIVVVRRDGSSVPCRVSAAPIRRGDEVIGSVTVYQDMRPEAERRRRDQLLAATSELLGSTLDGDAAVRDALRIIVPGLSEMCAVHVREGERLRLLRIAHADPGKERIAIEAAQRLPPLHERSLAKVVESGEPVLAAVVTEADLRASALDAEHGDMLVALGVCSVMVVPLEARDRRFGTLTFVRCGAGRFEDADLDFATAVARRVALALDNARLYAEALARATAPSGEAGR